MWIDDTTSLSREASGGWRRSCGPTLVGLASLITYNYSGLASWGSNRRIFILNSSARFKVSEESDFPTSEAHGYLWTREHSMDNKRSPLLLLLVLVRFWTLLTVSPLRLVAS